MNQNTASAFQVVYLNAIKQSAATIPGTFTISGGLSEFDNGVTNYTINIEKSTDATKKGTITSGLAKHGSVVKYTVPEPGTYNITIEDGKSCGTTFSQTFSAQPVQFSAPTVSAKPGQIICIDITVKDFINITSGQFTISFDTSIMKYSSIQVGTIPGVSQGTFGTVPSLVDAGKITVAYDAPGASLPNGITAADGSVFAKICFLINSYATTGQSSPVSFDGSKTNIMFENKDGNLTFQKNDGKINITTGPLFTVDITPKNTSCKNSTDGSIKVTATGGITPYTIKWQLVPLGPVNNASNITVNGGSSTINGLAAGTYSITVTDGSGIPEIQSVEIQPASNIGANLMFIKKPSCAGKNDGQVYVEVLLNNTVVNNPTPPLYTFAWSNGSTNDTVGGLKAGFIEVFVFRNINGCIDTARASGTITEPQPISLKINKQDVSCLTNAGQAGVSVSGGTPNYSYKWNDNQTNATAINLSAGLAKVTVTDANKCTDTISTIILPPNKPKIDSIVGIDEKCFGANTGSITVYAQPGGSAIGNYSWSNSQSGATLNNIKSLIAGTYTVTVTGIDGCTSTAQKIITEPSKISIDSFNIIIPKCNTAPLNKGQLTVFATGGTGSYTYYWSSSLLFADTTNFPLQVNLPPAIYSVIVKDQNGCTNNQTNMKMSKAPDFNMTFPPANNINVKCFNGKPCDGQALVTPFGGNSTLYKFVWSSGEVSNNTPESKAVKLCQGWQTVTITDGYCNIVDSVLIKSPDVLTLDTASVIATDVSCFGSKDGRIVAQAKGGIQPYSFVWPFFGNLQGNTIDKIVAGTYGVVITDANGCKATQNITIKEPAKLVASIDPSNTNTVKCNGDNNGVITVVCNNCQGVATYLWPNNEAAPNSNSASNLAPGLYVITVTDEKGCTDTARINLTIPPPIIGSIPFPEPPQCYGYQTVVEIDTAYGGSGGPYRFSLDDGPTRPVTELYDVYAGKHIVKIFDINGCYKVDTITVVDPPNVIVYLGKDTVINLGDSLLLTPQIISVLPIDTLIWSPLTNLNPSDRDGLLAPYVRPAETTTYKLLVYDSNGCPGEDDIKINIDRNRNVYIPNVFHANEGDLNKNFRVFIGPGVEKINYTKIFDRWGNLVYSDTSNKPEWDGSVNGRKMNPGVYVYVVEVLFIDNVKLLYRGDVTLLR
ncbi:MAG: gliding motility-associated C-terminal domain-containing protein [Saprospiraceae bacterium]|nr:gliding motility-associated C-terminal domain-containing protein [Saprospiraceae bacterium]